MSVESPSSEVRSESWFRLIVEAAPSAMLLVDGAGRILLVNRSAERLFGYPRGELLSLSIESLMPERFRVRHPALVQAFFERPRPRWMNAGRELLGLRKDGVELQIEIGLCPIEAPDGPMTLASIVDITARKTSEDELQRRNADLEQFAYIAAHDLQEPLRMVASYTELLAQRYQGKLDERADKYIHYAVDGARRMQVLISDLLAYARVGSQSKPLVPVSAQAVLQGVVGSLAGAIKKAGASIDVGPLPLVLADDGQLAQLFQNLLSNALKFRSDAPLRVEVRAVVEGERWLFSVADNGIGFDMQHAERIFQMFQRLHERAKYQGSGIGLALATRVLERHGGKLWAQSAPNAGATFFFTLQPAAAPEP